MAYSFDAGSNAFLFFEEKYFSFIAAILHNLLSPSHSTVSSSEIKSSALSEAFLKQWDHGSISITSFLVTEIGMGPERLDSIVF